MAEAWIKMRIALRRSGKVMALASALNLHPSAVCGAAFVLWSIADEQTTDGKLRGYSFEALDREIGVPGFCEAASKDDIEWVRKEPWGVYLPRFGEHNGETAKRRAVKAKSEARNRHKRGHTVDTSVHEIATSSPPRARASKEQAKIRAREEKQAMLPAPDFAASVDACSLLARVGLSDGAVRHLMGLPHVDDCAVVWACTRLAQELGKASRGKREPIDNPAAYVRDLLERHRAPSVWRTEWNRKRLAAQAEAIKAGGAA